MTNSVNKVPLSSVEETTSDKSKEVDEFDVVDDFDTNYILEGAEELEQIEFNVLANEISHPENLDIDSQIKEIKSLSNKDISGNSFIINNKRGFISVENISIPEEGNVSNLKEITISGKFLPWPKHFPETRPINYIFLSEKFTYKHFLNASPSVLKTVDGGIDGSFLLLRKGDIYGENYGNLYGGSERMKLNILRGVEVNSFYTSINEGFLSGFFNQQGNIDCLLNIDSNISSLSSSVGNILLQNEINGNYLVNVSLNSVLNGVCDVNGESVVLSIVEGVLNTNLKINGNYLVNVSLNSVLNGSCNISGELSFGYGSNYGSNYSN